MAVHNSLHCRRRALLEVGSGLFYGRRFFLHSKKTLIHTYAMPAKTTRKENPPKINKLLVHISKSAVLVSYPLIQNNGSSDPLSVAEQLSLEPLAVIGKMDITSRSAKVANAAAPVAATETASGDVEDLAGVDQVRVGDVVVSANLLPRSAELGANAAEGVAVLDGDGRGPAAVVVAMVSRYPTEAAAAVLDDFVQADAGGLVGAIEAGARGMEHVLAVSIKADVAGGAAEVAGVVNTTRVVVVLLLLLVVWAMMFLSAPPLIILPAAPLFLLSPLLLLLFMLLVLFLFVALILPVGDAILELVSCHSAGNGTNDGAGLAVACFATDCVAAGTAGNTARNGAQNTTLAGGSV